MVYNTCISCPRICNYIPCWAQAESSVHRHQWCPQGGHAEVGEGRKTDRQLSHLLQFLAIRMMNFLKYTFWFTCPNYYQVLKGVTFLDIKVLSLITDRRFCQNAFRMVWPLNSPPEINKGSHSPTITPAFGVIFHFIFSPSLMGVHIFLIF